MQLATALGYDTRIGSQFHKAGIGFGGGCLPKNAHPLLASARRRPEASGDLASLLHSVDMINQRSRERMVSLAAELAEGRSTVPGSACAAWPSSLGRD